MATNKQPKAIALGRGQAAQGSSRTSGAARGDHGRTNAAQGPDDYSAVSYISGRTQDGTGENNEQRDARRIRLDLKGPRGGKRLIDRPSKVQARWQKKGALPVLPVLPVLEVLLLLLHCSAAAFPMHPFIPAAVFDRD
jgi:hypothetical protein